MPVGDIFGKYIGIVGLLALGLGAGYIAAPFADVVLPDGYTEILSLCIGFFTARNGANIVADTRSKFTKKSG